MSNWTTEVPQTEGYYWGKLFGNQMRILYRGRPHTAPWSIFGDTRYYTDDEIHRPGVGNEHPTEFMLITLPTKEA